MTGSSQPLPSDGWCAFMCHGLPWRSSRICFGSKRRKTKGGRGGGQPGNQRGGGPIEKERCSMLPPGGEYGCLHGSGGRNHLGGDWEGPFGDGSSEVPCFFWSQPHRHWVEDLEALSLCICPVPSSALHSVHIPPKEALWDALMSSSNRRRMILNKNS